MEKLIFEAHYAKVYFIEDKEIGKIVWTGAPNSEEYKVPFVKLIELAGTEAIVTRFLSDIRNQGVVSPDSRKWFEKDMLPQAINAGLKRAAVISSGNVFKTYYINLILGAVNKFNLPFKIFNDEKNAMDFLMKE